MRRFIYIPFLIAAFSFWALICPFQAYSAENQAYFSALSDVPLMENMKELTDQSFVFDKAEGRVVEVVGLLSASSPDDAIKFYDSVLKDLGWKPLKSEAYERNNEQLSVKALKVDEGVLVTFQLSPVSR